MTLWYTLTHCLARIAKPPEDRTARQRDDKTNADARKHEDVASNELAGARQANDRATMGLVYRAGQTMEAESRVQAMLRGMIGAVDRDRDRDERH